VLSLELEWSVLGTRTITNNADVTTVIQSDNGYHLKVVSNQGNLKYKLKFLVMSNLVKSNFLPSFRSMMDEFWNTDRFFNQSFFNGDFLPAVNIRDTEQQYELEVSAPGFKKEDFKITTDKGLMTISAETSEEKNKEKAGYTRKEFSRSSFSRSFSLPDNVLEEDIKANYRDGLLQISLKKSGKAVEEKKQVLID
jgi:HSP20 family protein